MGSSVPNIYRGGRNTSSIGVYVVNSMGKNDSNNDYDIRHTC